MKVILFIILAFVVVFSVFGLLMCIEYLRYWKRCLVLNLRTKFNSRSDAEVQTDD